MVVTWSMFLSQAKISWEKITFRELLNLVIFFRLIDGFGALIVLNEVKKELADYAADAPYVCCEVILWVL